MREAMNSLSATFTVLNFAECNQPRASERENRLRGIRGVLTFMLADAEINWFSADSEQRILVTSSKFIVLIVVDFWRPSEAEMRRTMTETGHECLRSAI